MMLILKLAPLLYWPNVIVSEMSMSFMQYSQSFLYIEYQPDLVPVWCYPELSSLQYGVMPVYRTIQHCQYIHKNNEALYTDPFYTSKGGYKVTLRVYPNGQQGVNEGTHVSVFVYLMKGANDNNLQFPMTGIFTVQMMNWKGDSQHVTHVIKFDEDIPIECRKRVITGERASWDWDRQQLISHDELEQYIHKDKICIKITFRTLG